MEDKVTLVITSSNRLPLLRRTIYSFLTFNTYPISEYIIIDDSANAYCHSEIKKEFGSMFKIICNTTRIGQINSIDKAYLFIKTPWIFHLEDDWQFYRDGFIEDSLALMKADPKILQVWLREMNDTNGHPVDTKLRVIAGIPHHDITFDYQGYYGFSFNPGLKRLSDYELIGLYAHVPFDPNTHPSKTARFYTPEMEISKIYYYLGMRAVILPVGSVKHIGAGARVGWD
jgi:hypothetical protein